MKRFLALAAALSMALQFCAAGASAADGDAPGKTPVTIVAELTQEAVYSGEVQYPTAVTQPESVELSYSLQPKDADTYAVTITAADPERYDAEPVTVDFTIQKAKVVLDPGFGYMVSKKGYDGITEVGGIVILAPGVNGEHPQADADFAFETPDAGKDKRVLVSNLTLTKPWDKNYELDPDYDFEAYPVTSTIDPAPCTIVIQGELAQEPGAVEPLTAQTEPEGLPYAITYNGADTLPVDEGRYTVEASVTDANYAGVSQAVLTVGEPPEPDTLESAGVTDPALRKFVMDQIGAADREGAPYVVTKGDMRRLGVVTLENVSNLDGLEYADGLRGLMIEGGELSDLTPLTQVHNLNLERLSIKGTNITVFPPLDNLSDFGKRNFNTLELENNALTDITGISSIPNLEAARLSGNQISNLSPLSGKASLQVLELSDNAVTSLQDLKNLSNLKLLWLNGNPGITDVSPLKNLTGLEQLDLSGTSPSAGSLAALSSLPVQALNVNNLYPEGDGDGMGAALALLWETNEEGKEGRPTQLLKQVRSLHLSGLGLSNPSFLRLLVSKAQSVSEDPLVETDVAPFLFIDLSKNRFLAGDYVQAELDLLRESGATVWFQGQEPGEDSLAVPSIPVGNYKVMAVLQAPPYALPDSVTNLKLTFRNMDSPLPAGSVLSLDLPGVEPIGDTSLTLEQALGRDEQLELSVSFRLSSDATDSVTAKAYLTPLGGERTQVDVFTVRILRATINLPTAIKAGEPFGVYGETVPNATLDIQYRSHPEEGTPDDSGWQTAGASMFYTAIKQSDSWYTAMLKLQTSGTFDFRLQATRSGKTYCSEPATVVSRDAYPVIDHVIVNNGWSNLIEKNPEVGVPTFTAWTNARLIGNPFTLFVKFKDGSLPDPEEGTPPPSVAFHFGGIVVQAVKNENGYYTATLSGWSTTGVKQVIATVTAQEEVYQFVIAQVTVLIDPSGVIYDQSGQPIAGASVTLYQWDETNGKWFDTPWDANSHLQVNPQTTGADGAYGWMVPAGVYQVRATAPGYLDAVYGTAPPLDSPEGKDVIRIPPVRTDVDITLSKIQSPAQAKAAAQTWLDGLTVTNDTTVDDILNGVKACLTDPRLTAAWKEGAGFAKTPATASAPGSISGTILLAQNGAPASLARDSGETAELTISKTIAKLPAANAPGSIGGGGGGGGGGGSPSPKPEAKPDAAPQTPEPAPDTAPAESTNAQIFAKLTDVSSHWAADSIRAVVERGLFNGLSEDTFAPDGGMTRSMMVTVLYRLAGQPITKADSAFADVPADTWYTGAVAWAADSQIVTGTDSGFSPENLVTREQMAVMLYQYAKLAGLAPQADPERLQAHTDAAEIDAWARDAMSWTVEQGLLGGYPDGTLRPQANATRAEVSVVLLRLISLMPSGA